MPEPETALPHDDDAELALLGELLLFPDEAGPIVLPLLKVEDWHQGSYRPVARALMEGIEDGRPHDAVSLKAHLASRHDLDLVGGSEFIVRIMDAAPERGNISRHAEIVRELSLKRGVIAAAQRFLEEGRNGKRVVDVLADHRVRVEDLEREAGPSNSYIVEPVDALVTSDVPMKVSLVGNHVIDEGGLTFVTSEEAAGKTYLLMALAIDLARGCDQGTWLDLPLAPEPRKGLYLWGEGGRNGAKARAIQILQGAPCPNLSIATPREFSPDLSTGSGIAELKSIILDQKARFVIIDTLAEFTGGMDENDNTACKAFVRGINSIRRTTGALVILASHTRKRGQFSKAGSAREMRGGTALPGAADSILVLDKQEDYKVMATWGKLKDAAPLPQLILRLDAGDHERKGDYRFHVLQTVEPGKRKRTAKDDIMDLLSSLPGTKFTTEEIMRELKIGRQTVSRAWAALKADGANRLEIPGGATSYWVDETN